jgi:hypothetical protein
MGKILTYSSMFEGKSEDEKIEEFNKALNSPEGKDFKKWFWTQQVRTGRSYIYKENSVKGINIPSRSYFDKSPNSEEWYFEFSSSNGTYGTTYDKDLKSLLREFMATAVRKSRPSSITEKQIKDFFSKESNFPKGNFPDPEKIYSSVIGESGFITDFSFLMDLPMIKRISDLGIPISIKENAGLRSIHIGFSNSSSDINVVIEKIFGKEYSDSLSEIIKNIPRNNLHSDWYILLSESGLNPYLIEPKTSSGKNAVKGRYATSLRLGFDTKEKIEKLTEDFIKDRITLINPTLKEGWRPGELLIKPLGEYIKNKILGEPIGDLKEKSKERIEEILLDLIGPRIEKNPLDLYLLNDMPDLKEKVIRRYGIEDFSKLGRAFGKGFL